MFKSHRGQLVEGSHRGRASAPSVPSERDRALPSKPTQEISWMSLGPRAYPYRMGNGRPLEPPDNSSTRNPQFAICSMGVAETSPSVPRRDGEGMYKLVGEPVPITSNGPRLRGSTHGYTSWGAPNADDARDVRVAPPRPAEISPMPAETTTPHAGMSCEKSLQEHPRSCKASEARPTGLLARPHGITPATRGEESPINKRQHLRDPPGHTHRCSGATVGDSHKGPLNNQGKPTHLRIKQTQTNLKSTRKINPRAHGPPDNRLSHPRRNSASLEGNVAALVKPRLARRPVAPSGEVPPCSGAGRPLEWGSASLEGWMTPRAGTRLD
jgi:hypothetical protein